MAHRPRLLPSRRWICVVPCGFVVSGCKTYSKWQNRKEYDKLMAEMRPKGLEIARKVQSIYSKLPPKGSPIPSLPGLSGRPTPVFRRNEKGDFTGNTSVIHDGQLTAGSRHTVGWATSSLPYSLHYVEESPPEDPGNVEIMREMFTSDFARPYLIVVREVEYQRPEVMPKTGDAESRFRPGNVIIDAYLAEMASEALLAGTSITVENSEEIKYTERKNSKTGKLVGDNSADQLRRDLEDNAHRALSAAMSQATGGDILID